jgi:chorismate dehydratase
MPSPRIAASSYSNTAPLVWSFLYGQNHGKVEMILDNAPARSAELLAEGRVDASLVPVICARTINNAHLVPDVCVGTRERVRSVCLVTKGADLTEVRSVALDVSSKTSVVLTKIIFREFLGSQPEWRYAEPDLDAMLASSDAALIIGDPALRLSFDARYRTFDLAELWHRFTGLGFIFAMWMTLRDPVSIDFAAARDEGLEHIDAIAVSYAEGIGVTRDEMRTYLTENIRFTPDQSMLEGMREYFKLAVKLGLIER